MERLQNEMERLRIENEIEMERLRTEYKIKMERLQIENERLLDVLKKYEG